MYGSMGVWRYGCMTVWEYEGMNVDLSVSMNTWESQYERAITRDKNLIFLRTFRLSCSLLSRKVPN